jgi:hypothetical protein
MEIRGKSIMIRVGMIMGISISLGISSGMYVSSPYKYMRVEADEIGKTKSTDFSGNI